MKITTLGNTDILVSQVGLGTVKFGRNQGVKYPAAFELPDDKTILELLSCAQSSGINLIDTAPAYGNSEERLGKLLKSARKEWIICTKVGEEFIQGESVFDFSEVATIKSIDRSLQRLGTDYLDIVLVHSNGEDKKIIEEKNIFQVLETLKKSGKIRAFGMSTKTVEGGKLAIDYSDVAMVTYNPLCTDEQPVIAHAHKNKKGIFIKKAFASGHFICSHEDNDRSPEQVALEFIFKEAGVTSVILGTLNKEHLKSNIQITNNIREITCGRGSNS